MREKSQWAEDENKGGAMVFIKGGGQLQLHKTGILEGGIGRNQEADQELAIRFTLRDCINVME